MNLIVCVFFALFGLIVGSFLNALIYRLPRNINIAYPRSSCTSCNKLIYWYENIPVLSYIFLKGRCSGCGSKISLEYPIIELITAIASVLLMPDFLDVKSIVAFFFYFSVFCAFLVHLIIDLKHQILPDGVNLYLGLIFFINIITQKYYLHWALGAAIGFGFPYLVSYIFFKLKGQIGLGGGDIKLWAALGVFLGPIGIIHNIFLSCFLGAIVGGCLLLFKIIKKENPIPFGPFIIIIASFQIFFPHQFDLLMRYIS